MASRTTVRRWRNATAVIALSVVVALGGAAEVTAAAPPGPVVTQPRAVDPIALLSAAPADPAPSCTIVPSKAADAQPITTALPGEPDGDDEEKSIWSFITDAAKSAAQDKASAGAGWVLNLVLGNNGNQTEATQKQIEQELTDQRNQLNSIQTSVNALANQLTNAEYALKAQLANTQYDLEVSGSAGNIAAIQGMVQNVCTLARNSATDSNAAPYLPYDTDITHIRDIRANAATRLQNMSNSLLGDGGIIASYRAAWWANQQARTGVVPSRALWTAEYVDAMHDLVDYYAGLAAQLYNAYAEATHWNSPAVPSHSAEALTPGNPQDITDLYAQLRVDILAWTEAATANLPHLPKGTLVDWRTGATSGGTTTYTMWASSPVALPNDPGLGDDPTTPTHAYCVDPRSLCVYHVWMPAAADNAVASSAVVAQAWTPVELALLSRPLGYADWRLPTEADWTGLVRASYTGSGASRTLSGVDPAAGVATWAKGEDLPILQAQTVAGPTGQVTTIPPVVVKDATAQVLTFNDPKSAAPTAPSTPSTTGLAGRLALVRAVTTVPPDLPVLAGTRSRVRPPAAAAPAPVTGARTARTQRGAAPRARTTAAVVGTVGQPSTFTAPGSTCTTAYQQPFGANAISVTVTGAAGGSGGRGSAGGHGSTVTAVLPLQPGGVLYPRVGGAGGNSSDGFDPSTGKNEAVPGTGGTGGGGAGGGSPREWAGGGGGGLSGVSADTDCSQWLAIAGGGGGGGGIDEDGTTPHNDGLGGGNACQSTGCAGQTPTLKGQPATAQGAGRGGDLVTGGAGGAHAGKNAGNGQNGTPGRGGAGGLAIDPTDPLHEYYGGGGGGGGAGRAGGGGGGASSAAYGGAGGGGGSSYVAGGAASPSITVNTAGGPAQVVITPVLVANGEIGTHANGSVPTTVLRVDRGGTAAVRSPERTWDIAWQTWGLEKVGSDSVNAYYLLHNLGAGSCLTNGRTSGSAVALAACNVDDPQQAWKLGWQTDGSYALQTEWSAGTTALVASGAVSGDATPVTLAPATAGAAAQEWSILPVAAPRPVPSLTLAAAHTRAATSAGVAPLVATMPSDATGDIGFYDVTGGTAVGLGTAPLINGVATLTSLTRTLSDGQHTLQASSGGDAHYNPNDSNTVTVTVGRLDPNLTVSIPILVASPAKVTPTAKLPADATGTVRFTATGPGTTNTTSTDLGTVTVVGGTAHLSTPATLTATGVYTLTAEYSGDALYTADNAQTVFSLQSPRTSAAATPPSTPVPSSSTQTVTVSVPTQGAGDAGDDLGGGDSGSAAGPELAATGLDVTGLVLAGALLVGVGLVLALRRRHRQVR
ncbi:Ig-like domain-containing protein [Nakamurella endophytica]|uniref:Ig-like domain-containing protein n=1 Tax=Nakamurella endophytica TaxID=1748367 RepID=A0A917SSQ6_9ACTN|nr:Ig-like domain-containing protein [Nakamurella endophytica]GGL94341.1 hypothetical protein GCM10011594_12680 [Nakamurella endophytica]